MKANLLATRLSTVLSYFCGILVISQISKNILYSYRTIASRKMDTTSAMFYLNASCVSSFADIKARMKKPTENIIYSKPSLKK